MQKYVLAGVGTVTGFNGNALLFNAKTLTESSASLSVTAEDVRGGLSNPLLGRYFHDALLDLTITDALFDMQYLALNAGGNITIGGDSIVNEQVTTTEANKITVAGTPVDFGAVGTVGWYSLPNEDSWTPITFDGQTANAANLPAGTTVCVKYNAEDDALSQFVISSNIIPSEIRLEMVFPLFAAGTQKLTQSSQVGELIIDVPRFMLNGSFDLSMTSTGASTSQLSGSALVAYESKGCNDMGQFATVKQRIYDSKWYDGLTTIAVDNADIQLAQGETTTLKLWGVYNNGTALSTKALDNTKMTYTVTPTNVATVTNAGVVTAGTAGTATIKIVATDTASTSNPIEGYASITVA